MAAANWGMEFFDNYLKGKPFTLYTDRKPLQKLSHLQTKMMNQLQENMLTFWKQFKQEDIFEWLSRSQIHLPYYN